MWICSWLQSQISILSNILNAIWTSFDNNLRKSLLHVLRKEMGERDREPEDFMFKVWSFVTGSHDWQVHNLRQLCRIWGLKIQQIRVPVEIKLCTNEITAVIPAQMHWFSSNSDFCFELKQNVTPSYTMKMVWNLSLNNKWRIEFNYRRLDMRFSSQEVYE